MPEVGAGRYRYEVVEGWGRLPEGWIFGNVTGVAVDSHDRVVICQQQMAPPLSSSTVTATTSTRGVAASFPSPTRCSWTPTTSSMSPTGVDHVAMKFTMDGQLLLELGDRGHPSDTGCTEPEGEVLRAGGPFNMPTRISPSPLGDLYVSDGYKNCRIHRFSSDGKLISSWGSPGEGAPGNLRSPHSLWVTQEGSVYVCDRLNNRIQIFSADGDFVDQWTDLTWPTDLFVDANGHFFVAERLNHETKVNWITVRDSTGKILARWDTPRIHQLWVDSHGDIFLVTGAAAEPRDKAIFKYIRKG